MRTRVRTSGVRKAVWEVCDASIQGRLPGRQRVVFLGAHVEGSADRKVVPDHPARVPDGDRGSTSPSAVRGSGERRARASPLAASRTAMPAEADPYPIVCCPARGRNGELGERYRRVGSQESPTVMCCHRDRHRVDGEANTGERAILHRHRRDADADAGLGATFGTVTASSPLLLPSATPDGRGEAHGPCRCCRSGRAPHSQPGRVPTQPPRHGPGHHHRHPSHGADPATSTRLRERACRTRFGDATSARDTVRVRRPPTRCGLPDPRCKRRSSWPACATTDGSRPPLALRRQASKSCLAQRDR